MPWKPKSYEQRKREAEGSAGDAVYNARRRADPTSTTAMVERWRRSRRWQALRRRLMDQRPLCVHCQVDGRTVEARELDHVVGAMDAPELFYVESNLQPLCTTCHAAKSRRERAGQPEPERYAVPIVLAQRPQASTAARACEACGVRQAGEGSPLCAWCEDPTP